MNTPRIILRFVLGVIILTVAFTSIAVLVLGGPPRSTPEDDAPDAAGADPRLVPGACVPADFKGTLVEGRFKWCLSEEGERLTLEEIKQTDRPR